MNILKQKQKQKWQASGALLRMYKNILQLAVVPLVRLFARSKSARVRPPSLVFFESPPITDS